ncbi:hypothetical protein [Lysobacter silvisoli]|uniref:hypothetical protein n=1 Tax=Lysobacter silvisoli TaxID=2293254 RepID=UPI0018C87B63|nr:hypothetical protein [Lysobacter silvisoli]
MQQPSLVSGRKYIVFRALAALLALASPLASAAAGAIEPHTLRPDGSAIRWRLDVPDAREGRVGLIVAMQGSGCEPASEGAAIEAVRAAFSGLAVVTVDKYGVEPRPAVKTEECSAAFYRHHTLSQRVADYRQVVDSLRGAPWWNGDLLLLGGSEGGAIAAQLAGPLRAQTAIIISTGGGARFGDMFRSLLVDQMNQLDMPAAQRPDIDAAFDHARQNPDSTQVWMSASFKFWADALSGIAPVESMLKADTQFLLIQGGRDAAPIVQAARAASDAYAKAGRCELTYWEFPGLDHAMKDGAGGDRMPEVLTEAHRWWLAKRAVGGGAAVCGAHAAQTSGGASSDAGRAPVD